MKKIIILSASLLILLAGCSADEPTTDTSETTATSESETTVKYTPEIWIDDETGCHYLIVETGMARGSVAITPRMDANHTQMCDE